MARLHLAKGGWCLSLQRWSFWQILRKPHASLVFRDPQRAVTAFGGTCLLDLMGGVKSLPTCQGASPRPGLTLCR